jgi:hypothetical protein
VKINVKLHQSFKSTTCIACFNILIGSACRAQHFSERLRYVVPLNFADSASANWTNSVDIRAAYQAYTDVSAWQQNHLTGLVANDAVGSLLILGGPGAVRIKSSLPSLICSSLKCIFYSAI